MLLRDLTFYRRVLRGLSVGDLAALYERTAPQYEILARAIADELDARQEMGNL